ncbi:MAG: phage shock protein A [Bacillariaceae sp.]|jgi:phage shock protein A
MTRDRKKSFIATIEKTIEELESSNQRMNAVLKDVKSQSPSLSTKLSTYASASASMTFSKKKLEEEKNIDTINVGSSNSLLPRAVSLSDLVENENDSSDGSNTSKLPSKKLKIIHGFSLQY